MAGLEPDEVLVQHRDRRRAESFGAKADRYERTRPTYPAELVDDLAAEAPISVLDVGCGTGKAGRLFVERGCQVLGVEPDPRMAEVARRHGIDVEVATFETWPRAGRTFDLVISAQAWHWVDPTRGPVEARAALRTGGRLAVFANLYHHEPAMKEQLERIYTRLVPEWDGMDCLALGRINEATGPGFATAIAACGRFDAPEHRTYGWEQELTTEEWLDGLPTFSDHAQLPSERLTGLLAAVRDAVDDRGGVIRLRYLTDAVTAGAT